VSGDWALAVLGDPIAHSRSPELHRAGLAAIGLEGRSEALRTSAAALPARLAELREFGFRGANLTRPLKAVALRHLDRVSETARRARSVNTIGIGEDGLWGDTTDGVGFVDLLAVLGRTPASERVLLLGGGGAARSLALALLEAGATVTVAVRDPRRAGVDWAHVPGVSLVPFPDDTNAGATTKDATVAVNCTPLAGPDGACPPGAFPAGTLVVDLVYGAEITPWVRAARARGLDAFDGLGLLVHQARRSLERWTGREVPVEPLARAVGWPR
jgi:shikimate dehydrogenase